MNHTCDRCDRPAEVHEFDPINGVEIHLCREHAVESGFQLPEPTAAKVHSQIAPTMQVQISTGKERTASCRNCGSSFARFRKSGLLGCPDCYQTFDQKLDGIIARSQNKASAHIGRVPEQAADLVDRHARRRSLLDEIERAVASEQYERAAVLRDQLETLAEQGSRED